MIPNLPFYVRWMAIGCFVAFVTVVILLTFDHKALWAAWAGLAIEAAITSRVVVGTVPIKHRHPSTVRARTGQAQARRPS